MSDPIVDQMGVVLEVMSFPLLSARVSTSYFAGPETKAKGKEVLVHRNQIQRL